MLKRATNIFCLYFFMLLLSGCSSAFTFNQKFVDTPNKQLFISDANVKTSMFHEETAKGAAIANSAKAASIVLAVALGQVGQLGPALANREGQYLTEVSDEKNKMIAPYDPSYKIYEDVTKYAVNELGFKKTNDDNAAYQAKLNTYWGLYNGSLTEGQYRPFYRAQYIIKYRKGPKGSAELQNVFECHERSRDVYTNEEIYTKNAAVIKTFVQGAYKKCIENIKQHIKMKLTNDLVKK